MMMNTTCAFAFAFGAPGGGGGGGGGGGTFKDCIMETTNTITIMEINGSQ